VILCDRAKRRNGGNFMTSASKRIATLSSIAILLLLSACSTTTQTTSGKDYLAAIPVSAQPRDDIDYKVRQVAEIEPILRFPARIGIARVGLEHGRPALVPTSSDEASAWAGLADDLGPDYGELVPVSPLIAALVAPPIKPDYDRFDAIHNAVDMIRVTAARQHLDAVLIYEVDATADSKNNPLSIADWTLIGAFVLPSQNVKAQGVAQALLLDVRNGYPYGTITATADDKTIAARFASHEAERTLSKQVETAAVQNLVHEARGMMRQLKTKLTALDKARTP
jgi:hypothetical protein